MDLPDKKRYRSLLCISIIRKDSQFIFSLTLRNKKFQKPVYQNGSPWNMKYQSGIRISMSSMHLKIQSLWCPAGISHCSFSLISEGEMGYLKNRKCYFEYSHSLLTFHLENFMPSPTNPILEFFF